MATVAAHLTVEDLEARYRGASHTIEKSHFQAVWLLAKGHGIGEVAKVTAFTPRWLCKLIDRYNRHGPDALGDRRAGNGQPGRLLTEPVLAELRDRLTTPPPDGGLWSGGKVAAWLAERHGLETVHPQRGWEALRKIGWSIQTARPCNPKAATPEEQEAFKRKLEGTVVETRSAHPDLPVEVWAIDEHRLGLKPVRRRVWAPAGQRPIALGHHRYKWLHVTAFVQPTSGETAWYLSNAINKPLFEKLLEDFARQTGAGQQRIIVLVLDNAGWHGPANLAIPDGIRLVFLPPYTPELQPAERLWPLVDEPVANRYFETLDDLSETLAKRCCTLQDDPKTISGHTDFHWWPATTGRN